MNFFQCLWNHLLSRICYLGLVFWCISAQPPKEQCRKSIIFPPLNSFIKVDQNIFFPKTCFAYSISESKFTVCGGTSMNSVRIWKASMKMGPHYSLIMKQKFRLSFKNIECALIVERCGKLKWLCISTEIVSIWNF